MLDLVSLDGVAEAQYCGNAFSGQLTIPVSIFSSASSVFVKLERRSWFFDEAGWVEIPPAESRSIAESQSSGVQAGLMTIR